MNKTKLYIIGNGFDLYHEIRSGYGDFKAFLTHEDNRLFELVRDYIPVNEDNNKANGDWSNLEAALGEVDIDYMVDNNSVFLPSYASDDWSDSGHHDFQYEIGRIVDDLSTTLRSQFAKWVRIIEIPDALNARKLLSTLDKEGLYLSFNYTSTLASLYSVPMTNTLHIHGVAGMRDSEIVLGHAWNPNNRKSLNDHPRIKEQDVRVTEAYDILDEYFSKTFKPSAKIIQDNNSFSTSLRNIKEIVVLGHSLSDVDRSYFEAVVKAINITSVRWTIACRDNKEVQDKSERVMGFGVPFHLINMVLWDTL